MIVFKFLLVYFIPFQTHASETGPSSDTNLSLPQIRARSQTRSGGRFAGPVTVPKSPQEDTIITYLTAIRKRCTDRNTKGRRRYPRSFNSPRDEDEQQQNADARYLNKISGLIESGDLAATSLLIQLYNEIRDWKPLDDDQKAEKIEEYIKRLEEIKQRALDREVRGLNKYPRRDNYGSQENKDSIFLSRRPSFPEAVGLWAEIRAWKPENAVPRRARSDEGDPIPLHTRPRSTRPIQSQPTHPRNNHGTYHMGSGRGIGPPDEIFKRAWFDVSLKTPGGEEEHVATSENRSCFMTEVLILFLCSFVLFIRAFCNTHASSSPHLHYEEL